MPVAFRSMCGLLVLVGLAGVLSCEVDDGLRLPARESESKILEGYTLLARIAHVTDSHLVDEESPARFAGAGELVSSAWRPYEAYSTQLLDGTIRTVNRIHASGRSIDFLMLTGDACDNAQQNELGWFLDVLDGGTVDPLTGPDDRALDDIPPLPLDPHAAFTAQGLYRQGTHGDLASIPWYSVLGNHDRFSIGVFAIQQDVWGHRTAQLPLLHRPGVFLPAVLDPIGWFAHGHVTPANPGPVSLLDTADYVPPNADRRFFNRQEFIEAMFTTVTGPEGHGFDASDRTRGYYSVSPVPGLRLIGLDTCEPANAVEGFPYHDGSVSAAQVAYLRSELATAQQQGELVIVASHHPSGALWDGYGSALIGSTFCSLLNEYPNVILHLAGHHHRNVAIDRTGYLEIETGSTLDLPQEARLVEVWQRARDGSVAIAYEMFSHRDDDLPALGDDPLRGLREAAYEIAANDAGAADRQKRWDATGHDPAGMASDRRGVRVLRPGH